MTDNFDDRNNENIMNQNNTSPQGSDCTSDVNVQETPKAAEYVCNILLTAGARRSRRTRTAATADTEATAARATM